MVCWQRGVGRRLRTADPCWRNVVGRIPVPALISALPLARLRTAMRPAQNSCAAPAPLLRRPSERLGLPKTAAVLQVAAPRRFAANRPPPLTA